MPGILKKVRFSRTKTVHSPATPALTYSSASPASSAAPLTPPSIMHGLPGPSPYQVSYPPHKSHQYPSRVRVHPYLEFSGHPSIFFDLRDPPSMISRHNHTLSRQVLSEPATNPALPSMVIVSPRLPWQVRVGASNRSYVTLGDVLDQLYSSFRLNVTSADYNNLRSQERQRASQAYEHRYRRYRSQSMYEHEKRGGMKRVDFLMGVTRLMGLSSSSRGSDIWNLNFG